MSGARVSRNKLVIQTDKRSVDMCKSLKYDLKKIKRTGTAWAGKVINTKVTEAKLATIEADIIEETHM